MRERNPETHDEKLNYLGFSYGTRLGAVYAARFPGKVGRMALDGVDTLTEPLADILTRKRTSRLCAECKRRGVHQFTGVYLPEQRLPAGEPAA